MLRRATAGAIVAGIVLWCALGRASTCGDDPGDAAAIAAVRATVDAGCECAGAPTHGAYVTCARTVASAAVRARTLRPQCQKAVVRCAARSTCGRPGAVACCRARAGATRCRHASSAARCVAQGGCPSAFPSCCDACGPAGCATTSTTSTSPSTSTTVGGSTTTTTASPPTTICAAVCGNGVCEEGEDFSTCLADCSGVAQARTVLPIAIGECQVAGFLEAGCPAGALPLVQIPDVSGSSCFSSLTATPASVATAVSYLPATCCSGTTCGQGVAPELAVGDVVSPVNGQLDALLRVLADCVADGTTDFVAPVVPCDGSCNQGTTVVGFVGVHVTQVVTSGASKGVFLVPVCSCGDGACSAGESCQSCRADCGACPPVCQ